MAEPARPHLCLLGDASSVHLRRWAQAMAAREFRVSVVTARPQPLDGIEQVSLPPVRRSSDWLRRAGAARRAVAALAPDLVHAHYISSYGYLAARIGRRPLLMTAWGSDLLVTPRRSRLMRALTGWTLRQADLLTGDSLDLVAAIDAYHPRRPALQVHWGADLARFAPVPWADRGAAGAPFEIVSLRSWEPNYRIPVILDAVAQLQREAPARPLCLHLLGGGPDEARLRAQAAALGLQAVVRFHGRLDDAGMAAVLARCKASVSVPASDATSVSVLESMAAGVPVIASDLPANRQWLDAALIVPVDDAAALAAALRRLRDDDAWAQQVCAAQRLRMQRDGDRAVQMDRMAALYRELLAAGCR
ncbi:MAG TPA: glycosyltransferase [Rubrivivax sp.]|nr:glycosyltransferase [Rubrivivax sp.]